MGRSMGQEMERSRRWGVTNSKYLRDSPGKIDYWRLHDVQEIHRVASGAVNGEVNGAVNGAVSGIGQWDFFTDRGLPIVNILRIPREK